MWQNLWNSRKQPSKKDAIIFLLFQETFENFVQRQEVQGWIINIYFRQYLQPTVLHYI